jgi:hypothetical protein
LLGSTRAGIPGTIRLGSPARADEGKAAPDGAWPELWLRLMTDVPGYARFGAHGGDIGAYLTNRLGSQFPEQVAGMHVTMVAEADLGPGPSRRRRPSASTPTSAASPGWPAVATSPR